MKLLLPVCAALSTAKLATVTMQGLVIRDVNHRWVRAPDAGLRVFTPTSSFLASSALPFGLPPSVAGRSMPLTAEDQEQVDQFQQSEHEKLESQLGFRVTGYVTHADASTAPLVVQELPDVVGTKIWAGEWFLWGAVSKELLGKSAGGNQSQVKSVLELGAGCGLCGLLLAANGFDVTLTDTSSGYSGAQKTWDNMVKNVEANAEMIEGGGGKIRPMDLDWTNSKLAVPRVDLAIGADIIYEPHLFRALMDTIKRSSARAILIQNVARAGTEQFRALCKAECSHFSSAAVSMDEFDSSFPASDGTIGRYEVWDLRFDLGSQPQCK